MIRLVFSDGTSARMRWTDQHPASSHGLGVVLFARSSEVLDGPSFRALVDQRGARIECSDDRERRRVAGAIAWPALGLPDDRLVIAHAAP